MPRRNSIPTYRRDSKGRAFVEHKSIPNKTRRLYLGRHGTPESVQRYQNFLARLAAVAAGNINAGLAPTGAATVNELIVAYLEWARHNYTRETGVGSEYECMLYALRPLAELFGETLARDFGPRSLVAIRTHLAASHYRTGVNRTIGRIKRFWRWCCETELAPPELYHRLECVAGLYPGQENAREKPRKAPADIAAVAAILPYLRPVVAAMVQTQYLAGMRPGEVCILRPCDVDRTGDVWLYRPQRHKTQWRNYSLVKAIPRAARPIIAAYLDCEPTACAFRTPRGDRYKTSSYRRAIKYGVDKAAKAGVAVELFTPNQLRHAILADVSRVAGQQTAQRWAGHEDLATTNIYTGLREAELIDAAAKLDAFLAASPLAAAGMLRRS